MTQVEKIVLNKSEKMPIDSFQQSRNRPLRRNDQNDIKHDTLASFLKNDRHVLRFYCIWDDSDAMFGEVREFVTKI